MVPSGPPTPMGGGAQPGPGSMLLQSNSGLMGGGTQQPNSMPSQPPFSSLISPRTPQFSGNSLLANISNVSSLLNHSFQNGGSSMNLQQRNILGGSVDVLGNGGGEMAQSQHFQNPNGGQMGMERQQQGQQMDSIQNFQQQFSQQQQQQQQRGMGNAGNLNPVKLEAQHSDQNGSMQQQLHALRGMGQVKMEQQLQSLRSLGSVKMEAQHSDAAMFLQQQQQQQQLMHLSRQSSQASSQMNLLQQQQQRVLQQQQQQLILKSLPQQRGQFQQQAMHHQGLPIRPPQVKPSVYEPGMCARRLTHYMYHQQHRPDDNNIEFWRKFVFEYFAPNAKKRWCVSLYGSGRQTTGVFPQDVWHCEICNRKPGRGFETTVEVLPRLNQIKYASGTLEELLYVDMPHEYQNSSGQIVLDYAKAIQESVFEQLRVVRDGQLRIVFNPDLKIASWEFCARRHEELVPRKLIISQVSQLGAVVHKYQTAAQNTSSALSSQDLQNTCNSFVASARQIAKALEVPLVNDLGYTKRYVRCLQISEVVNSMKDLIDYSRETKTGPMESLINFPRRTSISSGIQLLQSQQQQEEQQPAPQSSNHNDPGSGRTTSAQLGTVSNGISSMNNSVNAPASSATSAVTMAELLHQSSMNSRQENNQMGPAQIASAGSSNSLPPSQQPNLSSPSNNTNQMNTTNSPSNIPATIQQQRPATQSQEPEMSESPSSVQQILQEMMMSSQLNGANYLVGNGIANGNGFMRMSGIGSSMARAPTPHSMVPMNGRVGMNHISQDQQEMGNRLLGGLGTVNNFNNLQFDWKNSP